MTFTINFPQMELVSDCASRLRLMSRALDVRQVSSAGLLRLQKVTFNLDMKEGLLEAWALVLLANNQTDPQNTGEPTYLVSLVFGIFVNFLKSLGETFFLKPHIPSNVCLDIISTCSVSSSTQCVNAHSKYKCPAFRGSGEAGV